MLTRLILILIITPIFGIAQIQRKYSMYTADEGLNQNSIYDIIQDHKGYLWFSTANGISRFDGYEMHNYKFDEKNNSSIYGEFYFTFYEDSKNQLWISHDKGLSLYDRVHDKFINLIKINGLSNYQVYNILTEDDNNNLWILIANTNLIGFNINSKKIIHKTKLEEIESFETSLQKKPIYHNGIIIFQNKRHSLYAFDTKTKSIKKLLNTGVQRIEFERLNQNAYIAVDALKSLALEISFKGNQYLTREYPIKLKGNSVTSTIVLHNNKYYVGTLDGLYIIDKNNLDNVEYIKNFGQYVNSLMFMESMYVDKAKNIIFGTNGMGVRVYSPHNNKFTHIGTNQEQLNMTKSILTTDDGRIFVGLHAIGFLEFNKNKNYSYKHIFFNPRKQTDYANSHVYAMTYYKKNEILLVYSDRLIVYDYIKSKIVKEQKKEYRFIQSLPQFEHYKNQIYVNVTNQPEFYIGKVKNDLTTQKIFSIKDSAITSHKFYNDSILIIGTIRGVLIHNIKSNKRIATIKNHHTKSILITKNKDLYFSSIQGIYKINIKGEITEKYNENSGMRNDNVYGILEDQKGNIWLSHNKGISVFQPYNKKFINFSISDGLQSNEFNTGSFCYDNNGLLYFGGTNGINIINPSKVHFNPYPPKISLNKIFLFDEVFKTDTFYNELNILNLNYTENTLSFDFSALDFSNPSANQYKYILEGYDQKIIESGTRHYARYANLPAGNYTLKIYGSNNDGIWSTEPKILYINIIPPYWQTTWFYILICVVGIMSILAGIYYYIYQQKQALKRKLEIQHQLELERLRISRDLHDHVGAQLSYLISNLDWLVSHPDALEKDEEIKRLTNLSETGRQAILTLRQTIWALNNSELSIEEFYDKFKAFAKKMLEFNPDIQINFKENLEFNHVLSPGLALNLFRICQEALANILKHAKATKVDVEIHSNERYYFIFEIRDNGIGFDIQNSERSNDHYGIRNMKARAEESNAELIIQSEQHIGTHVKLILKR